MIAKEFARVLKPEGAAALQPYELQAVTSPGARAAEEPAREQRAYERGVADGERRVQEQMLAPLERQNALLTALVREIRAHREAWLRDAEDLVAGLALEIAAKVLRERSEALGAAVAAQARELVARIRDGGPFTIRVHPQDVPVLEGFRAALAAAGEGAAVEIQSDPRVSRGGCLVETPSRLADARLEVQLARLGEALRRREGREGPDG
ncbi:FliH/SctL family protein [Nitrospira sp. Kam-Ns4a]